MKRQASVDYWDMKISPIHMALFTSRHSLNQDTDQFALNGIKRGMG